MQILLKFENVEKVYCWPHAKLTELTNHINEVDTHNFAVWWVWRRRRRRAMEGGLMFTIVNDLMCLSFEQTSQMSRLMFVVSRFSLFLGWTCLYVCADARARALVFAPLSVCAYVVLFDLIQDNNVCSAEKNIYLTQYTNDLHTIQSSWNKNRERERDSDEQLHEIKLVLICLWVCACVCMCVQILVGKGS